MVPMITGLTLGVCSAALFLSIQVTVAQGQTVQLTAQVDNRCLGQGDIITVAGQLSGAVLEGDPILIKVQDPQGNIDRIDQVSPALDGSYSYSFVGGGLMNTGGIYTVIVTHRGMDEAEATFIFEPGGTMSDWRAIAIRAEEATHYIEYLITGCNNRISEIQADPERKSLLVLLSSEFNGTLQLRFSKEVFDAEDGRFEAFADGLPTPVTDLSYDRANVLEIYFPAGTKQVEIVGDYVIPEFNSLFVPIILSSALGLTIAYSRRRKG